ncbi:Glucans biosynthesis protein C [Rubripirellula tenax]|uniref:Glucans biosynthesis protein C n=2 Tax=Rubripirellula tenax TaxID=2528015 RepID=A0A5C6FGH6_9BACT|nr:Glucans biosynthesis protein C [Rubripirellula tenax]
MLLGIALHAAIAFIPGAGGWMIKDSQTSDFFGLFLAAIHGFRMPLFFLISGFFTMMLYRRRGLKSLLGHRIKRIFIPMIIGLFTIIPAMWVVGAYVQSDTKVSTGELPSHDVDNIHVVAAVGDVDRLDQLLSDGVEVDLANQNRTTPLMMAVMFGQAEAAKLLVGRGADPSKRNEFGSSASDMLELDDGTTKWVADMIGIQHDAKSIAAGRTDVAKLLPQPSDASRRLTKDGPQARKLRNKLAGAIATLTYIPLFGHLWFLWFLCWLVVGFAIVALIGRAVRFPNLPASLTKSSWSYAWAIPLTMIPQAFMGTGAMNFGPDTSIGLLPMPAVLVYYAIFFGFGAMYFDAKGAAGSEVDQRMGRRWAITIPLCLLVLFPLGIMAGEQPGGWGRFASVFAQASYVWLMSLAMIGVFRRYLSSPNRVIRYLSDSSYWLYLAHLPLVILVQSWLSDYPMSPFLKFPIVCLVTTGILLASYQCLVRYSPIGTLLNGKRRRFFEQALAVEEDPIEAKLVDAELFG